MKNKILIILLANLFLLSSCDVLQQASDVVQFVQCDFSLDHVRVEKIGGVSLANIKKPEDLGVINMLSLTQQVLSGNLPATLNVGIKATNNQSLKAGISGLDWELYMKENKYGAGMINQLVEILPNNSTTFPVTVEFDLLKLVTSDNIQQILDLVFDIDSKEKLNQLDLQLRLKPFYKVGSQVQEYPGFITVRP